MLLVFRTSVYAAPIGKAWRRRQGKYPRATRTKPVVPGAARGCSVVTPLFPCLPPAPSCSWPRQVYAHAFCCGLLPRFLPRFSVPSHPHPSCHGVCCPVPVSGLAWSCLRSGSALIQPRTRAWRWPGSHAEWSGGGQGLLADRGLDACLLGLSLDHQIIRACQTLGIQSGSPPAVPW